MLLPPHPHLSYFATNDSTPTTTAGTSVTSGGSANAYGNWIQIHAGFTSRTNWVIINLNNNFANNTNRNSYVDIGIGPNSGAVTTIVEKLCGTGASSGIGKLYFFPLHIPLNTIVWARHQNYTASTAIGVQISVMGGNMNPGTFPSVSKIVCLGATTASTTGTTITPGTGAEGSWTPIVTSTTEDYAGLMIGAHFSTDTSWSSLYNYTYDIGLGGSGSEYTVGENIACAMVVSSNEQMTSTSFPTFLGVPIGARISVRGCCSSTPDSNISVVVYGFVH